MNQPRNESIQRIVTKYTDWPKELHRLMKQVHLIGSDGSLVVDEETAMSRGPVFWLKWRCKQLEVTYEEICGPRRVKPIQNIQVGLYMEMYDKFPAMSLPAIGRAFKKDHSTILKCMQLRRRKIANGEI
jgi:hypothetical protein